MEVRCLLSGVSDYFVAESVDEYGPFVVQHVDDVNADRSKQWTSQFGEDVVLQSAAGDRTFVANQFVPVDSANAYGLTGWAKSGDEFGLRFDPANQQSFGIEAYDANYQLIGAIPGAALDQSTVPSDFTFSQYIAILQFGAGAQNELPSTTAFIRPTIAVNQHGNANNFVTWRDVIVRELPSDAALVAMVQPVVDLSVDVLGDQSVSLRTSVPVEDERYVPSEQLIKVDVGQRYSLTLDSFDVSEYGVEPLGIESYDADGRLIHSVHVSRFGDAADTFLAQSIHVGDTTVFINDAGGWSSQSGAAAETRSLAWYGYADDSGSIYPDFTYTRNVAFDFDEGLWAHDGISFDSTAGAWRIDLLEPWSGPMVAAGTAIRNATGSESVQQLPAPTDRRYTPIFGTEFDSIDWFQYSADVGGETWQNGLPDAALFRPGTVFIQPVFRGVKRDAHSFRIGSSWDVLARNAPSESTFGGAASVTLDRSRQLVQADHIQAVDELGSYRFSVKAASGSVLDGSHSPVEQHSIGYLAYDSDGLLIEAQHVTRHASATDTTLAVDLNPNDATITLSDGFGWSNGGTAGSRSLAWFGYENSAGHVHPDYTYTRNIASDVVHGLWDIGGVNGNVITLREPWAGPAIAAGSAIRNATGGDSLIPVLAARHIVANEWTDFTADVAGEWQNGVPSLTAFPPGTAQIRVAARANEADFTIDEPLQLRKFSVIAGGNVAVPSSSDHRAVLLLDVLQNDPDLTATTELLSLTPPAFGVAEIVTGGGENGHDIIRYTSAPWFTGTDVVTYTARDSVSGSTWSNSVTVTVIGSGISSDPALDAAIAAQSNDSVNNTTAPTVVRGYPTYQPTLHTIRAGQTLVADDLPVLSLANFSSDADGDTLVVELVSGVSNGVLDLHFDGTFVYSPLDGFAGVDGFEYRVSDGLHSEIRAAQIRVLPTDIAAVGESLRQITLGLHHFHDVSNRFPYNPNESSQFDSAGHPLLSWRVHILRYLGYQDLYDQFRLNEAWDSPHNILLLDQMPPVFSSPGDSVSQTNTRFQLVSDLDSANGDYFLRRDASTGNLHMGRFVDMQDGRDHSVFFVQSGADVAVPWTSPQDIDFDPADPLPAFGTLSNNRIEGVSVSGSQLSLATSSITNSELTAIITTNGGEPVDISTLKRRDAELTDGPRLGVKTAELSYPSQFRKLLIAFNNYHDVYGEFPVTDGVSSNLDDGGFSLLNWRVHLLPFLGQQNLFDQFHLDEPWDSPHNITLLDQMPDIYRSGGDLSSSNTTRIQVFTGPDAPFGEYRNTGTYRAPRIADFRDGNENTALFAELGADRAVPWTAPQDAVFTLTDPLSALGDLSDGNLAITTSYGLELNLGTDVDAATISALVTHDGDELLDANSIQRREEARSGTFSGWDHDDLDNQMKVIGLGIHNFHDVFTELPWGFGGNTDYYDASGIPHLSWRVYILPFIGQNNLFQQFHLDEPWDSVNNLPLVEQMPDIFRSHGDSWDSTSTRFRVLSGPAAPFGNRIISGLSRGPRIRDFLDGTADTFLVVEAGQAKAATWTKPGGLEFDPADVLGSLGRKASDVLTALFADGSVNEVSLDYSDAAIAALVSHQGREVVTSVIGGSTAGFSVTPISVDGLTILEGEIESIEVVLDKPGNVQIDIIVSQDGVVVGSVTALTFTTDNWDVPQAITLEAVDDLILDGTESTMLSLSVNAPASDDEFDALPDFVTAVHNLNDDDISEPLVDDSDSGFTTVGSWGNVARNGHNGGFRYATSGDGSKIAEWKFDVAPGQYRVLGAWRAWTTRATDAPFTILSGGIPIATFDANQQVVPDDALISGTWFDNLGTYVVNGTQLTVRLTDDANGLVVADAVAVEYLGPPPVGPEASVSVDGATVDDNTGTIDFGNVIQDSSAGKTVTISNQGTEGLILVDPITLPAGFTAIGYAAQTVAPGASISFTLQIDTASLGFLGGEVSFLSNDADESPYNFTVQGLIVPPSPIQIVDNSDTIRFSTTGSWNSVSRNGHTGGFHYATADSGVKTARWEFAVAPGEYRISATWRAWTNRATDATFTILDVATPVGIGVADQTVTPDTLFEEGSWFNDLGFFVINGNQLVVELSDFADGLVVADAIRIERIGNTPVGPEVTVTVDGLLISDETGVLDFGDVIQGTLETKTVTVSNPGTGNLMLTGPITVPTGFTATGFTPQTLAPGTSMTFDIEIDTAAPGAIVGEISFGTNDTDESPYNFAIQGNIIPVSPIQILDNSAVSGFATTGNWTTVGRNGYAGGFQFASPGNGLTTARWEFNVDPGQYRVSAAWRAHTNRATDASFSVIDDVTHLGTAALNQTLAPNELFEDGTWFNDIGRFNIVGNLLVIELTDLADGLVIADAIRIERLTP